MEQGNKNKNIKKPENKSVKVELTEYYFPEHNKKILASSIDEAQRKLLEALRGSDDSK